MNASHAPMHCCVYVGCFAVTFALLIMCDLLNCDCDLVVYRLHSILLITDCFCFYDRVN